MRLSDSERAALVARFMAQVEHQTAAQLRALRTEINRRMTRGRPPLEADLQANYDLLLRINHRINELERAQQGQPEATPEEALLEEAARLAKIGGVSVDNAKRFMERSGRWDVARKHIRKAPEPEPPLPSREETRERRDLRPYRAQHPKGQV